MRIRLPTLLACGLLLAASAQTAHGGWNDRIQGLPVLEHFTAQQIGADSLTMSGFQDQRGRLFFVGRKLAVYDGVRWRDFPSGTGLLANGRLGQDGRIWVGGLNQIGYFTETAAGEFVFTSLLDQLPPAERKINSLWGIGEQGGSTYFITDDKLLCWDGHRFRITAYPTSRRLFPVRLEGETWFVHPETGLYRITDQGPKLEYPRETLARSSQFPAMYLYREKGELRQISNDGIVTVGQPDSSLHAPELLDFCRKGRVTNVVPRPGGGFFISTINSGMAIVSADGRLLRVIDQSSGLSSDMTEILFLDRENGLWLNTANGLYRLDVSGASSLFQEKNGLKVGVTASIDSSRGDLWVLNTAGLHRLAAPENRTARFEALPGVPSSCSSLLPQASGLLLGCFAELGLWKDDRMRVLQTHVGHTVTSLWASGRDPGLVYYRANLELWRMREKAGGEWQHEPAGTLPGYGDIQFEDSRGRLWLNSFNSGILCYDPQTGKTGTVTVDQADYGDEAYAALTGARDAVYFAHGDTCFAIDPVTLQPKPVGSVPGASIRKIQLSADGHRLYAFFSRLRTDGSTRNGLGYLDPAAAGGARAVWTELATPGLDVIGSPRQMLLRIEEGADALWLGGTESVLRVRPGELQPIHPPEAPVLRTPEQTTLSGGHSVHPYAMHRIHVRIETTAPIARRDLMFQTRLGSEGMPWSAPSTRDSFEFTNLREGDYTFAVRGVNPAGQASPAAEYRFRILPPWYRTDWAYGGGLLLLSGGVLALVRLRERRARRRTAELERLVAERTEELVQANAAKDQFLAGISHEIRNPMNGVVGLTTAIDTSGLDEASREHFAYLRHCATHLSNLLEDILDFSKVQAGAITLDLKPFSPRELAESLVAITAMESQKAGIPVETAVAPEVPAWLLGDAPRIRQVLLNFIINALKYAGRGQVSLTVWCRPLAGDRVEATFAVSDDGPGMTAEERQKLFLRFERGAAARERRVPGAGLGLALCRELAEKMDGRIWVESEPGQGSTFHLALTLPVSAPPAVAPVEVSTPATPNGTALIVDDEAYNRLALASHLASLGFATELAADAETALRLASGRRFDAVFLDFDLPGRPGPDIARALRLLPAYPPEIPIVAITAFNTPEKRAICLEAGMTAFLSKPVSLEQLRSALEVTSLLQPARPLGAQSSAQQTDPLATLRLIAVRKGVPFAEEFARFVQELEEENAALAAALQADDAAAAARAAHKLVGRMAFVRADVAELRLRELEAALQAGHWVEAATAWQRFQHKLPPLLERLRSAAA